MRFRIINYGYDFYLKTGKVNWAGQSETPVQWKKRMSGSGEWGDEVCLNLACNVLGVNIVIAVAFQDSNLIIRSLDKPKHELYLFYFSESYFSPAHYISIRPRTSTIPLLSLPPAIDLTEESMQDIPVVLADSQIQISEATFNSVQVLSGLNPESVIAQTAPRRSRG